MIRAFSTILPSRAPQEADAAGANGRTPIVSFNGRPVSLSLTPGGGMVRYMNEKGLRRKFDMESYLRAFGA
jgi:hypothetical protein